MSARVKGQGTNAKADVVCGIGSDSGVKTDWGRGSGGGRRYRGARHSASRSLP